jgi:porphobilinogen synthase
VTAGTLTRGRLAEHPVWRRALDVDDLVGRVILPLIVSDAVEDREVIPGTGGIARLSITEAVRQARAAASSGIAGVLVLGASERKDETAMLASEVGHVVPRAVLALKDALPDLAVATDVCVCGYTTHGQCVLFAQGAADIAGTLERLAEIARVHADAGSDLLIPSGMLDGTVAAIRSALSGAHDELPVAAVAAVESSLGQAQRIAMGATPIRERAVPLLDPTDRSAADARVRRDLAAGGDAVVVAPGMVTLDLVASLRRSVDVPILAQHAADEHAIFTTESDVDGSAMERELLAASRRAGADLIITYGALGI